MDTGVVVALAWLTLAIGATALFGPSLGLRGWLWLGLHHLLCLLGVSHELWRKRPRGAAPSGGPR